MKNIYIDCGTHLGQGLIEFSQMFNMTPEWEIYTFEPNPYTLQLFIQYNQNFIKSYNIKYYNNAVSTHYNTVTFNIDNRPGEGPIGMGSSIMSLNEWNPTSGTGPENFNMTIEADCINLREFIETFSKEDNIVIKLDIEGAEYDILEDFIKHDTLDYINHLYVEFHSNMFTNSSDFQKREDNILDILRSEKHLNFTRWH
jgi:FkbM family methyltransferase